MLQCAECALQIQKNKHELESLKTLGNIVEANDVGVVAT
jgi:hypothetical protein